MARITVNPESRILAAQQILSAQLILCARNCNNTRLLTGSESGMIRSRRRLQPPFNENPYSNQHPRKCFHRLQSAKLIGSEMNSNLFAMHLTTRADLNGGWPCKLSRIILEIDEA